MLDLRSLRQFVVLAEELHFGRAAQRLHMTQPPLTLAVKKMEQALGVELLARNNRRVALTPAGQCLLTQARPLLAAAALLPAQVQAAAEGLAGALRLGFVSTVGFGEMPIWLRCFRERFPQIQLTLREATLDVQLQAFARGEMDAGFVIHAPGAAPAGFQRLEVMREVMVLAHADTLHFDRLDEADALRHALAQPLITFPRDIAPSLYDAQLGFYRAGGFTPQIVQEAIQMQTIINLVSAGMGVAWVPESLCKLQRAGVRYRRFAQRSLPCETSLLWREDAAPTVDHFVAHVRQALSVG